MRGRSGFMIASQSVNSLQYILPHTLTNGLEHPDSHTTVSFNRVLVWIFSDQFFLPEV